MFAKKTYSQDDPLDGIVAYFTELCYPVHPEPIVVMPLGMVVWTDASSSLDDQDFCPENAVQQCHEMSFCSKDLPNSWLSYWLPWGGLLLTSYSIKSCDSGPGGPHPKSWVLEGRNRMESDSWVIVDSRQNNFDLNRRLVIRNFKVSRPRRFDCFRLRQTGKNHHGDDRLCICVLELFGTFESRRPETE